MSTHAEAIKPPQLCPRCGSTRQRGHEPEQLAFLDLWYALSEREREVMLMIAQGVKPAQISEQLGISAKTVATYRTRALEKLEMEGTAEIAVAAYKAGLLE